MLSVIQKLNKFDKLVHLIDFAVEIKMKDRLLEINKTAE